MDRRIRRPRIFKLIAGIVAVLSALVLGLLLWIWRLETAGWAAMEARIGELTQLARTRSGTRPVLRGEGPPGNAWDEYLLALSEASKPRGAQPSAVVGGGGARGPDLAQQIEQLLKTKGSLIEHLRKGTQCAAVFPPISSDSQTYRLFPVLGNWDVFWQALTRYARLLAAQGKYQEAAECLTDLCLFGADLSRNTESELDGAGMEIRRHALHELRFLVINREIPNDCLSSLERELEVLDRAAPDRASILLNDTAKVGRIFLFEPSWDFPLRVGKDALPSFDWRHLFSKRLLALDLFRQADAWNGSAAAATRMPWQEAIRVHHAISAESSGRPSVFGSIGLSSHAWAAWTRATQAKVRLLRVAVHYRLSGEVMRVSDPFGEQLLHEESRPGHMKAWSLGAAACGELADSPWADRAQPGSNRIAMEVDR
jgi:hypothetical protein